MDMLGRRPTLTGFDPKVIEDDDDDDDDKRKRDRQTDILQYIMQLPRLEGGPHNKVKYTP